MVINLQGMLGVWLASCLQQHARPRYTASTNPHTSLSVSLGGVRYSPPGENA